MSTFSESIGHAIPAIVSSIVAFLAAQAVFGIIWLVRQEARIQANEVEIRRLSTQAEFYLRRFDAIESRVNENTLATIREMSRLNGLIDLNNATLKRIDDQQMRIISALDQNYNLLNEHLRIDHTGRNYAPPQNPPLRMPQAQ